MPGRAYKPAAAEFDDPAALRGRWVRVHADYWKASSPSSIKAGDPIAEGMVKAHKPETRKNRKGWDVVFDHPDEAALFTSALPKNARRDGGSVAGAERGL